MSTIKKLWIQGIRSFEPTDHGVQVIEFFHPLTLIVGQNGCGKTTIIEALKYAITNDYPPGTDKGHSFVNDPKLTSGFKVKAVIKAEVVDALGDVTIVSKRLEAVQTGKNLAISVKALEGTIHKKEAVGGREVQISGKCADLKEEMCRIMGVHDSILKNVIFCHQDESCWPLEEGKKLKEKFDAIFNTTMYIKCFDHLTKLEKDILQRSKIQDASLKYAEENMKIVRRKRTELEDLSVKLQVDLDQLNKLEKDEGEIAEKLKALEELEKEYTEITNKVSEWKGMISATNEQVGALKKRITKPFEGTLEELKTHMVDFKSEFEKRKQELGQLQRDIKAKDIESMKINAQINQFNVEKGKFQKEENDHHMRVMNMKGLIGEIGVMVKKIRENALDESLSATMDTFIEAIEKEKYEESSSIEFGLIMKTVANAVRAKEQEMVRLKEKYEGEEKVIQGKVDEIKSRKTSFEKEIEMKEDSILNNKKTIEDLRKRLISVEGSNETLALLDDEETKFAERIEAIEGSGIVKKCEDEITSLNEDIKDYEDKIAAAQAEVDLLQQDKNKTEQIAIFTKQKIQKQKDCSEIMGGAEDRLKNLLGTIPDPEEGGESLSKVLDRKIKELGKEVKEREGEQKKKEIELGRTEQNYKQIKRELQKKEAELEEWKDQVTEVLEGRSFDIFYEEVVEKLEKAEKDVYYSEAAQFLYKKYVNKLNSKPCCPLCTRDFAEKEEVSALQKKIESEIENMKKVGPQEKAMIEKLKDTHKNLVEMKPIWDIQKKVEDTEIPELRTKRNDLEEKISALKEEIETINEGIIALKSEQQMGNDLAKIIPIYEQNLRDLKKFKASIDKLESARDPKAKECKMNLPQAQLEIQDLQSRINSKRMEKDNKEEMRNKKRDELAKNQDSRNKVREEKLRITSELQNRDANEVQKKELEEANKIIQEEIAEIQKNLPGIRSEILAAEKTRTDFLKKIELATGETRTEKDQMERQKSKLNEIRHQVEEFEVNRAAYAEKEKKFSECKAKLDDIRVNKTKMAEQVEKLRVEFASQEIRQRDLQDNQTLKEKEAKIESLTKELNEKEQLLNETQNQGVAAERRDVQKKHHELCAQMNQLKGIRKTRTINLKDLERELSLKPFCNAEDDFREKLVKSKVLKLSSADLKLYKKILDEAIMKFHKKRMEKINENLKELWRKVYKGNDIEYVQIKTNEEEDPENPTMKIEGARKSYNYRVVMFRQGCELDMRGRCSAGQKVLASIIIRIALAQAFASKCGILTLDEPTTNLDQENIDGLAEALANLTVSMQQSKSFQLVIITHDQSFIERLLLVDPLEYYYKVFRNRSGYSQIKRMSK